jgi:membrane-associated PAP2 superfamily phosphatase
MSMPLFNSEEPYYLYQRICWAIVLGAVVFGNIGLAFILNGAHFMFTTTNPVYFAIWAMLVAFGITFLTMSNRIASITENF